ncbi:MAG: MBL fold metallo-hydrolase [Flavobacteriaceae bacterium]|nr:MBL fold metallo-hydrolase [Flavobacteriaceae bacterium]
MKIEQIYTGCLAQGAYYIESNGEVAIIDPLREVDPYIKKARENQASIKYILETHFHADFVSGHISLAEKTGATIVFGPNAKTSFDSKIAKDNEILELGNIQIKVLHTPGHTMESTTYLLIDETGKEHAIFTGDTLFLGDVGRPDLAQKAADMTQEELAATLFDSLRQKIMPLNDEIIVYPGHGAGSACGKNMMKETVDTLGNQKQMNYALREDMTKDEFVKEVTDGLLPPPKYFPLNVKMNKDGYEDIDAILERGTKALSPDEFETAANETGAVVLDVRHQDDFAKGHIPGSTFIGLDGTFAPWVGALIADVKQPILIVADHGKEEEAVIRLSRVGFDYTLGYLKGGFESWKNEAKEYDQVVSIPAQKFKNHYETEKKPVFDVRKPNEYQSERLPEANNTPLDFINSHLAEFPNKDQFYVHCAGGYRSMIAASILKKRGIHNLINIEGGFDELKEIGVETTEFVCPSTL